MKWEYDSWNRIKNITYPDGEQVFYAYNRGGTLDRMWGEKLEVVYPYITGIKYNQFESKTDIGYGNGTGAHYRYDILQRLSRLDSYTPDGEEMQKIVYTYDSVSNIKAIENLAGEVNGLGGQYRYDYVYDNLYRLEMSEGHWNNGYSYGIKMEYEPDGKITRKSTTANGNLANTYNDYFYEYNESQPHTVKSISEKQFFEWDKNGNLTAHYKGEGFNHRRLCWDEENRLRGVADDHYASIYGYDAGGERAVKFTGTNEWIDVNGSAQGFASLHNLTLYTSPYLVASQKGYTKHYYIENQRIASKLGNGGLQDLNNANQAMTVEEHEKRSAKVKAFKSGLSNTAQCLNLKHFDFVFKTNCPPPPNAAKFEPCLFQYMAVLEETEPDRYFYHPDHLGSSSWITDAGGKPIQHLSYLPFGEEFVDQRTSDWSAAYKFTGKEKDEETGYNYFGARYYMSDLGIWASVDPLSDMYPSWSAYNYCLGNPIKLIDPDGTKVVIPDEEDQKFIDNLIDVNSKDYSKDFHDIYKELDAKDHIYSFESWAYGSDKDDGKFKTITNSNKSIINFTKDDNPQITQENLGASRYRVLFEEAYHAKQHANGSHDNSCIREAEAWKFSAFAPGTKTKYNNNGYEYTTVMGRLQNSSISSIAWGFKMGMPRTENSAGIKGLGLYNHLPLGNKNEKQLYFPILKGVVK